MARREPWARSFDDNGDFEPMAEINVTPMVDVMLVRLIIFMVAGMPVNLPQTAAAKQNPPQKPLVITIAADAKYYIRNEARLISQDLMRCSTMKTINTSAVGQYCQVRNVSSKYRSHAFLKKNFLALWSFCNKALNGSNLIFKPRGSALILPHA